MKIATRTLSVLFLLGISNAHPYSEPVSSHGKSEKHIRRGILQPQDAHLTRILAACNENLIKNSDGNNPDPGNPTYEWIARRATLDVVPDGYKQGSKAFKISERFDLNSGISQSLTSEHIDCLKSGDSVTFSMWMKLEDEFGNPFACNGSQWNQPTTCPLLSFRVTKQDGSSAWFNSWNQANLAATGGWQTNSWNLYTTTFSVSEDMASANSIYFTVRGPAQNIIYYVSDASFKVDGMPTSAPTVGTVPVTSPPTFLPVTSPPTALPVTSPPTALPVTSPPTALPVKKETSPPTRASIFDSANEESMSVEADINYDNIQADANLCDMGVVNGDFENGIGDLASWIPKTGGTISLFENSETGNQYGLKVGNRTTIHDGPKHPLNMDCFVTDRVVEVRALIKLMQGDDAYVCDPTNSCPILTLEFEMETGDFFRYYPNDALISWKENEYNEFQAFFTITESMTLATKAFFYFERPPAGVDMIIDNVQVNEYQPVPEGNYHLEGDDTVDYNDCSVIVTNGDAESGDTSGWTPRLGGYLSVRPEGADNTGHSFEHNGRTSFIMGPKHALKTQCFVEGGRYAFDAKMKLLDEDGNPFVCDKTHHWIDESSCPILSFQVESESGKSWSYYGNHATDPWQADAWNPFNTFFTITKEIADATDAYFYIERPRAGVTLIVDEIVISRDCTTLIANHDAESENLSGWYVRYNGGGDIHIYHEGARSAHSFGHFGRTFNGGGPAHKLDLGCLVEGRQYEFIADFKLMDEMNGNATVACNKNAAWGDPDSCPLFAITLVDHNNSPLSTLNYVNTDPSTWIASEFNRYHAIFTVTEEMSTSLEAYILFKGPRAGVATLFDNVVIRVYEPPEIDCDEMVPRGDFEDEDYGGWHIRHSGSLQIYDEGALGGSKSLLVVERTLPGSGLKFDTNGTCLVEGKRYEFKAQVKLLTEDGQPFNCTKSKGYNDPKSCPLFGFEYVTNGVTGTKFYGNEDPTIFSSNEWNPYRAIFTVPHELATSDDAFFMVQGPAPGIGIIIDQVTLNTFKWSHTNCNQLVINGDAETGTLDSWQVNNGGYISIVDGGASSNHAFIQTHRTHISSGPKHDLPLHCLVNVGDKFTFHAQMKLLDENGNMFACDKSAPWNTPLTCPLLSIEVNHPDKGIKRIHYANSFGGAWDISDWNEYQATVTVTQEMTDANDVFFYLQGVRAGASVIFDQASMTADSAAVS